MLEEITNNPEFQVMEEPEHPRGLAFIRTIESLTPIEGADLIECAQVLGWYLVVKKEEFQVGDPCVFFEIDSLLPEEEVFEFMRPRNFRVKTIKLRGQVSQGLALPLSSFKWGDPLFGEDQLPQVDDDITEYLCVKKWEPKTAGPRSAAAKGNFPGFLRKTDEERIQNCFRKMEPYFDDTHLWVGTEKLDGSSVTYYVRDGVFGVCSRNLDLKLEEEPNHTLAPMLEWAKRNDMEAKMRRLGDNFAFQGEIIGPGIQGNKYGLKTHEVYFFNAWDISGYSYFSHESLGKLLAIAGLRPVPLIETKCLLACSVSRLVDLSIRKSTLNPVVEMEGVVWRPLQEIEIPRHGRASFKVINPKFLLKYDE